MAKSWNAMNSWQDRLAGGSHAHRTTLHVDVTETKKYEQVKLILSTAVMVDRLELRSWCEDQNGHWEKGDDRTADGAYVDTYRCTISTPRNVGMKQFGGNVHIELKEVRGERYAQVAGRDGHADLDLTHDDLELHDDGSVTVYRSYAYNNPEEERIEVGSSHPTGGC